MMNKPQLIDCIAKKGNISKTEAKKSLELAIGAIRESLAKGKSTYEQSAPGKVIPKLENRPEMNLLHELAHAWDNMAGLYADASMTFNGFYVVDLTALRTENIIRKEMGLPLRLTETYNILDGVQYPTFKKIIDSNGNFIFDKYQH